MKLSEKFKGHNKNHILNQINNKIRTSQNFFNRKKIEIEIPNNNNNNNEEKEKDREKFNKLFTQSSTNEINRNFHTNKNSNNHQTEKNICTQTQTMECNNEINKNKIAISLLSTNY